MISDQTPAPPVRTPDPAAPRLPTPPDRRSSAARRPSLAGTGRFVLHYVEMVVAMVVGMVLLHPLWTRAVRDAAPGGVLRSVELDTLAMATSMSVPMVAAMLWRRHSTASALEMAGAMYAGFVVLYPFLWAGLVSGVTVEALGHALMLAFMLVAMLRRWPEHACAPAPAVGRRLWPALLGLVVAASQVATGVDIEGTAITVAAAASCYVAAAALDRPWVAWAGIPVSALVVTVGELAGATWWVGLAGYVVLLVAVGLAARAPGRALADQGLAMLVFGGLAVVALVVSPRLGLALAGLALTCHAVWDWRHWRRNDVVPRSLAEFCMLLDVPVGVAALAVAIAA